MKDEIIKKIKSRKCIIDSHTHVGISNRNYLNSAYPYCMSFEDLVIRMKYLGIDYSIVFPYESSYYTVKLGTSKKVQTNEEFSKFPYEIENKNLFKEIYEIFTEYSEMAIPFVMFDPSRKTKQQAELFESLYETYPLFGLKTCTTYIQSFVKDLDNVGRPILDFATRYNLPIIFHSSYDKGDIWASVYDIIDFAERHPEVKICIAHTARFVKSVLEKAASLKNCFVDLSAFDIHCLLVRMNHRAVPPPEERVDADYTNPPSVMKKIINDYPGTIIWGTDTPLNYFIQKYYDVNGELIDVSLKSSFDTEIKILKSLSDKEIEEISYRNTLNFLFHSKFSAEL